MLGGVEALLMRMQLGAPDNTLLTPETYNELVHDARHDDGLPVRRADDGRASRNYFVPLMIGARDMAFPRLNALSFWLLLFGGVVFYALDLLQAAGGRLDLLPAAVATAVLAQRRRRTRGSS